MLYPHVPDPETPILETARGFDAVFQAGKFKTLGLANYKAPQIEAWMRVCDEFGFVRPTVYQGLYNPLSRRLESDGRLEVLRKYAMVIYPYSPLAGGFLTGKATAGDIKGTRFDKDAEMGMKGLGGYDRGVMHAAVRTLGEVGGRYGLGTTEISLRWLMEHSVLGEGDGVIMGGGGWR